MNLTNNASDLPIEPLVDGNGAVPPLFPATIATFIALTG
jgi:hypothetical protein